MEKFRISERFRLEVHWNKAFYGKEGEVFLENCYLDGPVIKQVGPMNNKDSINLDFVSQYIIFIKSFYIVNLSWDGLTRISDKIYLNNAVLKNTNLSVLPKLRRNDYIVIDTENHEDEKHNYNMNYTSYLVSGDGTLYNFGDY